MDNAPKPILFHCHSGADRTGLASMMYLLLHTNGALADAQKQISFRYGHKFWSEAARLFAIPAYLVSGNVAVLVASMGALRGQRHATWEPTRRAPGLLDKSPREGGI